MNPTASSPKSCAWTNSTIVFTSCPTRMCGLISIPAARPSPLLLVTRLPEPVLLPILLVNHFAHASPVVRNLLDRDRAKLGAVSLRKLYGFGESFERSRRAVLRMQYLLIHLLSRRQRRLEPALRDDCRHNGAAGPLSPAPYTETDCALRVPMILSQQRERTAGFLDAREGRTRRRGGRREAPA